MSVTNRVLRAFSEETRRRLHPHLELVRLPTGKILQEPGDLVRFAFFPERAVISLLGLTDDGDAAEVAMVGNDGTVGLPIVLPVNTTPHQALVVIEGDAFRLRADILRAEFRRDASVQTAMLESVHRRLGEAARSTVCNRYHDVRQRLCRWLLMVHDYARMDGIPLTQEFLGRVLGATRKRVSHAAAELQDAGCIRQRHGLIRILNRRALEQRSCECYRLAREDVPDRPPGASRSVDPARTAHAR
jgi:CRP-like cAMP-binding protein